MNLCAATLLCFALFEPSSARLHNIIADLEDRICGKKQKGKCSEGGENYEKMKKTLQDVPVLDDFPSYNDEYHTAVQKSKDALTDMATFFNGNNRLTDCKNCVQEDEKKQLCAMKDPIYQGLLDNEDENYVDVTKAYCPVGHLVCSGIHDKHCNGDWYTEMEKSLETTSKTGEPGAIQAITDLMNFFTTTCKNCVDVAKTTNLCDTKKAIVTGIITYDDKDWADPTAKHCDEVRETNKEYLGCFNDIRNPRALPNQLGWGSVDTCLDRCRIAGYKYAARQWAGECWCGNSGYNKYGSFTEAKCDCDGKNVYSPGWAQCVYLLKGD